MRSRLLAAVATSAQNPPFSKGGEFNIRGVARLCIISDSTLGRQFRSADKKPSKLAAMLLQYGFDPLTFSTDGVPDIAVGLIVKHYAWMAGDRCTEQAKQLDMAFSSIGVRSWMQDITGWVAPGARSLTPEQIAEICLLPCGRIWQPRFEQDFYLELSRLTGLAQFGNSRPKFWGRLTDEWVYKMLPSGVREGVKLAKKKNGNWQKLHQFLSDDGLQIFQEHMRVLTTLMKAADSVNGVRRSLNNLLRTDYQYRLFDDRRKDGTLSNVKQLEIGGVDR